MARLIRKFAAGLAEIAWAVYETWYGPESHSATRYGQD